MMTKEQIRDKRIRISEMTMTFQDNAKIELILDILEGMADDTSDTEKLLKFTPLPEIKTSDSVCKITGL